MLFFDRLSIEIIEEAADVSSPTGSSRVIACSAGIQRASGSLHVTLTPPPSPSPRPASRPAPPSDRRCRLTVDDLRCGA